MYFKSELNGNLINVTEISSLDSVSETKCCVGTEVINCAGTFRVIMKNGTVIYTSGDYEQAVKEHKAITMLMDDLYGPVYTTEDVLEGRKAPWRE